MTDDDSLMGSYADGDLSAFDCLFTRLAPKVHRFFMRSFNDTSVADDLLQITFMKVHRARKQRRRDLPVLPWILGVAGRVRLDELRRRHGRREDTNTEALEQAEEERSGELAHQQLAELAHSDLAETVATALHRLPESQRIVIHLHRFEGLTMVEIAKVLGTTEGAVKLRAFRAYNKLREMLQGLRSGEEVG